MILKPLSGILNSPTRDTSQPQRTNISVYSPRFNWFTNSAVFFTCSGLFWFCLKNLLFLLMCCFSLPKYNNLCDFEGHWILFEIGFNPDTILRNLVDLSLRWQLNNVGDLPGRCLSTHQYFQVYWLGLERLISFFIWQTSFENFHIKADQPRSIFKCNNYPDNVID